MRVFVSGATGYIGSAVAKALKAHGHSVVGSARSETSAAKLRAAGIEPVSAALNQPEALAAAARAADGTIQLASASDATSPETEPRAAEAIVAALSGSGKPFVLTSGIWVYGATGAVPATEETPLNPFFLVAWRPAVERSVLDAKGMRGIVVRPGMVYGNGGGLVRVLLGQAQKTKKVRLPGDGQNHWPPVHVDDLAELYTLALEKAPAGSVLNGTSDDAITLEQIGKDVAALLGGLPVEHVPLEEARAQMGPLADALAMDQRVESPRSRALLGWKPTRPSFHEDLTRGSYRG